MAKIRETYGATYHAVMHHDESYTAGRPSKRVSGLYHTLKHKELSLESEQVNIIFMITSLTKHGLNTN